MKKLLSMIVCTVLCLCIAFSFTACIDKGDGESTPTPSPTPIPEDIDPSTVDVIGETWRVTELCFETDKNYVAVRGEQGKVVFDCVFTHRDTGTVLTIPGFWDGENIFKIRFAPTLYGVWEYKTECESDESLNGKTGTIGANAYKGDLKVYQHGFVKTDPTKKYFVYDDGTPFFYLGDTHWSMLREEFDSAGDRAGDIQTDSHFKYIVDKRIEQGYTVYQSQPLGADWSLLDAKIGRDDLVAFQKADKYFQYIADNGLTHANAQFFFSNEMQFFEGDDYDLNLLARYWVARFGAYPVMWTLAQEIDNDFYHERGTQSHTKYNNNPWVRVAEYINRCDAYNHPLSGHQEGYTHTTVTGQGTTDPKRNNGGKSVFLDEDVSNRTGHDWWASSTGVGFLETDEQFEFAKDYWASNKVAILYEGLYCYLWTKDFGARAQGWRAFLNGFFGYGYGAQDIWQYKNNYNLHVNSSDGYEQISTKDKLIYWSDAIELESGYQVGYMKQFLEKLEWWKLTPDFDNNKYFTPDRHERYSVATIDSDIYVIYLFNNTRFSGFIRNLDDNATYTLTWFNPRTNEYVAGDTDVKANMSDGAPMYGIGNKPGGTTEDWVILLTKNK
ncbi:MAG: DUF4038 domain-containing protein [Clostridia bacterium]|nr:DUF4038 domain-containing protein [Clostridia bacterium]